MLYKAGYNMLKVRFEVFLRWFIIMFESVTRMTFREDIVLNISFLMAITTFSFFVNFLHSNFFYFFLDLSNALAD